MSHLSIALRCVLIGAASLVAQTLRVGFTDGNAEPYAMVSDNNNLTGGIIKDICDGVGKELGLKVEYSLSSRNRLGDEIKSGNIAIRPIFNPAWTNTPADFIWSKPLFKESNILVYCKEKPLNVKGFDDLKGKRIGTILGYVYPTLQPYFDRKELVREDVRGLHQNFAKLKAGRIDALVESDLLVRWHLKTLGADFEISDFPVSHHEIFFAVSRKSPVDPTKIVAALDRMKKAGEIDKILAKYR